VTADFVRPANRDLDRDMGPLRPNQSSHRRAAALAVETRQQPAIKPTVKQGQVLKLVLIDHERDVLLVLDVSALKVCEEPRTNVHAATLGILERNGYRIVETRTPDEQRHVRKLERAIIKAVQLIKLLPAGVLKELILEALSIRAALK
jgi:hypothetical protein